MLSFNLIRTLRSLPVFKIKCHNILSNILHLSEEKVILVLKSHFSSKKNIIAGNRFNIVDKRIVIKRKRIIITGNR